MKHNYCVACGIRERLHQHHLVPKSRGGSNDETNLITLCVNCHEKIHGVNNSLIKLSAITREKKRREGKAVSGIPPYGKMKTPDGYLVDNPIEQKIIEKACELRVTLNKGSVTVSRELEKLGYVSRNGKPFDCVQINRILASKGIKPRWKHSTYKPVNSPAYDQRQKQAAKLTQSIGQTYEIFAI